jgi:hypothetical protein
VARTGALWMAFLTCLLMAAPVHCVDWIPHQVASGLNGVSSVAVQDVNKVSRAELGTPLSAATREPQRVAEGVALPLQRLVPLACPMQRVSTRELQQQQQQQ